MRLRPRWWLIGAGVVVLLVVLRFAACQPRPIAVEVARVTRGVVEDAVTNSQAGTVKARMRARVGAERAGRVAAIPHREGSRVKAGEPLLLLDVSTARTQLEVARRDLDAADAAAAAATANATLARQQHERTAKLYEGSMISKGDMDQSKSRLEGAEAELAGAEAHRKSAASAVRLAQDELAHLRVL